jgi:hypothetical protein
VLGLAILVSRRQWLVPAWLVVLLIVPGGEGRYAAVAWAMMAAIGIRAAADTVRGLGALRAATAIGLSFVFIVSLIAGYRRFDSVPADVRAAIVEAGSSTPPGTRFAIVAEDPSDSQPLLDWFPTLSGRISVGTYQGLEFTTLERWQAAVDADAAIQDGRIPADADYVFREADRTWEPAP